MLQGSIRRVDFYLKCVQYWMKLNRFGNFPAVIMSNKWAVCHACGMKWYLPTQYERSYNGPFPRHVMHLVDYYKQEGDFFVCGTCIIRTYDRGGSYYKKLQEISIMYRERWVTQSKVTQSFFEFGHLNNKLRPIFIGWFDLYYQRWYYGQVVGVADAHAYTINVHPVNATDENDQKQIICLSTRSKQEYFIYQRPSSQCSPLHSSTFHVKLYEKPESIIIDTTNTNFNKYMSFDEMYVNGRETFRLEFKLPVVYLGETQESLCYQLIHMKKMYDLLKTRNLLKNEAKKD